MKFQTLPVKRRPVSKGIFRRLSAVTRSRKQRVAAAAPSTEIEMDDGSSKISRALTIIFLIHIVAIGLIFIHQRFLDGRPAEATAKASPATSTGPASSIPAAAAREDLPRLSTGEKPYVVKPGDNYSRIATLENVDEADLRLVNKHVEIRPGLILSIPRRIVAEEPPEVTAIREQTPPDTDRGLVEAVDVTNAPKAQLVRPNVVPQARAAAAVPTATVSGKAYVVQQGDSIWRIANRFKISQDSLMRANGISDARRMKVGMSLVIPQG